MTAAAVSAAEVAIRLLAPELLRLRSHGHRTGRGAKAGQAVARPVARVYPGS